MQTNSRIRCIAVLFALATLAAVAADKPRTTVEFTWARDRIIVPLHIANAGPYLFLLDSSTLTPAFDPAPAQYLKLPAVPADSPTVALSGLRIGAYSPAAASAAITDFAPLQRFLGVQVTGLLPACLGIDPLTIDFPGGTLAYGAKIRPSAYPCSTPLRIQPQGLRVDILLNGKHLRPAALDTTSAGILSLPESFAVDLGLLTPETPRLEIEKAADTTVALNGYSQIRLRSVSLGGAELTNPLCTLVPEGESPVIGTGFLRNFRVAFEFAAGKLYLSPAGPIACPPVTGFGLVLVPSEDGYWTLLTAVNGPAYRNGLRSGDHLYTVDGTPMKDVPYTTAAVKIALDPGRSAKLTVLRNGEQKDFQLTSEQIF